MSEEDSTLFVAEQAVISAMFMDPVAIGRAKKHLTPSDFESHAHRAFFNAIVALDADGIVVDPLTLSARMEEHGTLAAAGGKDYIGYLVDAVPTAANVEYHARIIVTGRDRKRAVNYLTRSLLDLKEGRLNLRDFAVEAQSVLLPLALEEDGKGFRWITKQDVEDVLTELDRRAARIAEGLLPGIPTGYHQIDGMTQGFRPGEFVIFGGRDKSLKSYLDQNIHVNLALARIPSGLVSAEMNFPQIMERFLGTASLTGVYDMGRGSVTVSERERIVHEGARIENYIAVDDEALPELGDVIARCTELKAQRPQLQVLSVDYLQLVQKSMQGRRGDEEINFITRALKGTAKRLDVVMVALAQCNHKEIEKRPDKRPQIGDFQGASGMAQDADFRGLLYKADTYDVNAPPVLEINITGRRCGKFDVYLDYDPKSLAIYEKKRPRQIFGESAA